MRMLFAVALAGVVAPATAQTPSLPLLASGEVLLQIVGDGEDRRPADEIALTIDVSASEATPAEARASDQAKVDKLIAGLTALGIDRAAITSLPMHASGAVFIVPPAVGTAPRPAPKRSASTLVRVRLAGSGQMARVQTLLDEQELGLSGTPALALRDPRPARLAAIGNATEHARHDAEAEAAALGLRIGRMVRVANYAPTGALGDYLLNAANLFDPRRDTNSAEVVTKARVSIDYIAGPAR